VDERHYNINKLNIIFACSSVVLLMVLGGVFMNDYSRTWKDYQKDFRTLEIEKTRMKYDAALTKLDKTPEYQALVTQLAEVKQAYDENCSESKATKKEIEQLRAKNTLLTQDLKFTTAKLDAARYRYESQKAHGDGHVEAEKKDFETLSLRVIELKLDVERSAAELIAKTRGMDECGVQLKQVKAEERNFLKQKQILSLKLDKIDSGHMSFVNQIANMIRDLPIIDLANPNYKIEQIVLKDIRENVNFVKVPKVDRCVTCHLGISNPDYKDAPQPFTTHPDLETFIGRDSPHPVEEFGCTICHSGRGRGTDFVSSAHTPSTTEQAKEWEEKYDWEKIHHWDKPMLPVAFTESSCLKCHSSEMHVPKADKLNLGLQIVEKAGCYSCHEMDKYKGWPKPGPDLTQLASKVSRNWTYRWIRDPKAFRHNTWMPVFFGQSNNKDSESVRRTEQEIHAIVEYLFKNSKEYSKNSIPMDGDPTRGEELVASVGCLGCHQIESEGKDAPLTMNRLFREHGPNLAGIGTKTSKKWLYNWLKDPKSYHADTKMPNLRLSDEEAADIVAYLSTLQNHDFDQNFLPSVNEEALDEIVFDFLAKSKTHAQADRALEAMESDDKLQYAGLKLIRHYGCYSCHNIDGFEKDKPIGTNLSEEGDKTAHDLDFGFVHVDHTNYGWFTQKLKTPRIFDEGRVKAPDEKLRMPNYAFTDEEIEAVVTVLLGSVREHPEKKAVPRTIQQLDIEGGQRLVRQLNCQGCHTIEGSGGAIQGPVKEWLVQYDNRDATEAGAIVLSFSPPNLVGEGKKVQSAWLFDFLHAPSIVRPWLKARMPSYDLDAADLNTLLKYFSALDDEEFPFENKVDTSLSIKEYKAAEKLFSKNYLDCAKCHIVGDKMPGGSPDSWAPNFALTAKRLKPDWIIDWIMNPQKLLPGTKMPNYFDVQNFEASGPDDIMGGDEHEQIRVLRNYLTTLSDEAPSKKSK